MRINDDLPPQLEIRLITEDGLETTTVAYARHLAGMLGLDLVEINPNSSPPTCRLLDYAQFKARADYTRTLKSFEHLVVLDTLDHSASALSEPFPELLHTLVTNLAEIGPSATAEEKLRAFVDALRQLTDKPLKSKPLKRALAAHLRLLLNAVKVPRSRGETLLLEHGLS